MANEFSNMTGIEIMNYKKHLEGLLETDKKCLENNKEIINKGKGLNGTNAYDRYKFYSQEVDKKTILLKRVENEILTRTMDDKPIINNYMDESIKVNGDGNSVVYKSNMNAPLQKNKAIESLEKYKSEIKGITSTQQANTWKTKVQALLLTYLDKDSPFIKHLLNFYFTQTIRTLNGGDNYFTKDEFVTKIVFGNDHQKTKDAENIIDSIIDYFSSNEIGFEKADVSNSNNSIEPNSVTINNEIFIVHGQ